MRVCTDASQGSSIHKAINKNTPSIPKMADEATSVGSNEHYVSIYLSQPNDFANALFSVVRILGSTLGRLEKLKAEEHDANKRGLRIVADARYTEYVHVEEKLLPILRYIRQAPSFPDCSVIKTAWDVKCRENIASFAKDFGENVRVFLQLCCLGVCCGQNQPVIMAFLQQSGFAYAKEAAIGFQSASNADPLFGELIESLEVLPDTPALLLDLLMLKGKSQISQEASGEGEVLKLIRTLIDMCYLMLAQSPTSVRLLSVSQTTQDLFSELYAQPEPATTVGGLRRHFSGLGSPHPVLIRSAKECPVVRQAHRPD